MPSACLSKIRQRGSFSSKCANKNLPDEQKKATMATSNHIFICAGRGCAHRARKTHRTFISVFINGANAEKVIVLRHFLSSRKRDVADKKRIRPNRLKSCRARRFHNPPNPRPCSRPISNPCRCQPPVTMPTFFGRAEPAPARKARGVDSSDIRDVIKINKFNRVAVKFAVFGSDVLMLMRVIFVRFGKTYGGKTAFEKRNMVAAASVTVAPINHR
jgi:hypothetical protein